jgi:hypothetical protein
MSSIARIFCKILIFFSRINQFFNPFFRINPFRINPSVAECEQRARNSARQNKLTATKNRDSRDSLNADKRLHVVHLALRPVHGPGEYEVTFVRPDVEGQGKLQKHCHITSFSG